MKGLDADNYTRLSKLRPPSTTTKGAESADLALDLGKRAGYTALETQSAAWPGARRNHTGAPLPGSGLRPVMDDPWYRWLGVMRLLFSLFVRPGQES